MPKATKKQQVTTRRPTCEHRDCSEPVEERCTSCGLGFCSSHIYVFHDQYICDTCRRGAARKRLKNILLLGFSVCVIGAVYFILLNALNLTANTSLMVIGGVTEFVGVAIIVYGWKWFI